MMNNVVSNVKEMRTLVNGLLFETLKITGVDITSLDFNDGDMAKYSGIVKDYMRLLSVSFDICEAQAEFIEEQTKKSNEILAKLGVMEEELKRIKKD